MLNANTQCERGLKWCSFSEKCFEKNQLNEPICLNESDLQWFICTREQAADFCIIRKAAHYIGQKTLAM